MFDVYWKHLVNGRPETTKLTPMPVSLEDATRWANRLLQFKLDGAEGFQDVIAVYVERADEDLRCDFLLTMMGAISASTAARREAGLEADLSAFAEDETELQVAAV